MKYKLFILFICLSSFAFSQEISIEDFKELNNVQAETGKSSRKKKAEKYEELFKSHDQTEFKKTMFEYLKSTDYKNIHDYFWYSMFLMDDYYNSLIDKELTLEILQAGKIEIEKRLENANNTEEQELYLSMTRCQVLWLSGIYYFNDNELNKGGEFFDLAYENPNCIHAFPGTNNAEKEEIYKKYSEYRKH